MIYPLSVNNETITDASGEVIANVEPGPFGQGRINAKEIVELANLGYRTRQYEAELRNLTEIKGEPSFVFSPSVMVEFTKEEFSNFQFGIQAIRKITTVDLSGYQYGIEGTDGGFEVSGFSLKFDSDFDNGN